MVIDTAVNLAHVGAPAKKMRNAALRMAMMMKMKVSVESHLAIARRTQIAKKPPIQNAMMKFVR